MYVPFERLPDDSRIWIYQCSRTLTSEELKAIKELSQKFVEEWTAHQQLLHASFEIFHGIFLILAVDEGQNNASGCSVDKSIKFVKALEEKFHVSFFDRYNIAFRRNEKIEISSLKDFKKMYAAERIEDNMPVFSNLIYKKAELKNNWEIPLNKTWIADQLS